MATAPCSTDVFEHLDDAAREEAYRSAVSEAAALKTEVDQLRRELELLKMVPSKDHDAANDDDAPKPPLDPQLQASHDFLCNLLAPLIERIERFESRTHVVADAMQTLSLTSVCCEPDRIKEALELQRSHPMHMGLGPEAVSLSTTSMSHVYALFDGVCKAIVQGATAAFMVTPDDSAILEAIHKHRVTSLTTTPYTVRCMLDNDRRHSYDLSCLQYVTTATTNIAEEVAETLLREFNLKTFIQCDQCYYDDDGWLYLVARLSDFYCCRGSKFWPSEVEAVLLKCPEVHDCAVVGIPHPEAGEVAHALIVPEPDARMLSVDHVTRFVEANAPKGCHLEGGVTFVDKIPRNDLGKLVRRQLVQWIVEKREHCRLLVTAHRELKRLPKMSSPLKSCVDAKDHAFDTRRNFGAYIVQHLRRHAGSKLINGTSHEAITYGVVAEQVEAVRTALWRLGHKAGDKILILSANRMQLLPMFLGAACANVATMCDSPGFSVDVVADAMQTLSVTSVCCEPDRIKEALELQRRLPSIKVQDVSLSTTSLSHSYALFDGVCKAIVQGATAAFMVTPDDSAILEAIHKHRVTSLTTTPYTVRCMLDNDRRHSYDLSCLQYVTTGTTNIAEEVAETLLREFNLKTFIQWYGQSEIPLVSAGLFKAPSNCRSIGCLAIGVEAMVRDTETRQPLGPWERGELVVRSPSLMRGYWGRLHEPITDEEGWYRTGYGQSEIPLVSAGLFKAPSNCRSIGCLAIGVEAMVRDTETRQPLGPWERGELVVRSPSLMRGYWGRLHEPITDEEGWYRTGDQCYYDDDGWLYLVARLSDFYCCRGSKFWPSEVEAVLFKCPEVHDCAVVGIPHPEAGEVAHALIVPEPDARMPSVEHITRFVEANAPKGCHLEGGVTFVDKIPRNNLGKLVRRQLVQWIVEKREQ
ncbi:hypothetical protein HPB50_021328 [Hyalomma asiaticum]|uniref:Uncharacterized protein n=1 Tax=Hyalomma asiaticum TaxID=266040 RepID=A0ACB7SAA9_HYAAI|nr:hypothetical protein HPB50_021328 [Hyalomma asiaticum]